MSSTYSRGADVKHLSRGPVSACRLLNRDELVKERSKRVTCEEASHSSMRVRGIISCTHIVVNEYVCTKTSLGDAQKKYKRAVTIVLRFLLHSRHQTAHTPYRIARSTAGSRRFATRTRPRRNRRRRRLSRARSPAYWKPRQTWNQRESPTCKRASICRRPAQR